MRKATLILALAVTLLTACNDKTAEGELIMDRLKATKQYDYEFEGNPKLVYKEKPYRYTYYFSRPYTGKVATMNDDGKTYRFKGELKDGFAHGVWTYYTTGGKIEQEGIFENGFVKGNWTKYYKTGKPKMITQHHFVDGHPVTDTLGMYHPSGQLSWSITGDTVKTFYKSGAILSINKRTRPFYYAQYTENGSAVVEMKNSTKTNFTSTGEFTSRMYYLTGPNGENGWEQMQKDEVVGKKELPTKYGDSVLFEFIPGTWAVKQTKIWGAD